MRTVEILETELAEAQVVITRLMTHCQELAETIRQESTTILSQVRNLNASYQEHAVFMTAIDEGMKAHAEQTASRP